MESKDLKVQGPLQLVILPESLSRARDLYVLDMQGALQECVMQANNGNVDAAAAVAHMYLNRSIVSADCLADASRWAEQAIRGDCPYAHWVNGWICLEQSDVATGIQQLTIAHHRGFPPASYDLGQIFMNGWGVPRDKQKSRGYFRVAKEHGHISATRAMNVLDRTKEIEYGRYLKAYFTYPVAVVTWNLRVLFGPKLTPFTMTYQFPERVEKLKV